MPKLDLNGGFGGAASGAVTGGSLGSIIPGIGTAVGAGIGGLVGGAAGLFGKKKKKKKKVSTLDPQQLGLYEEYIKGLRGEGEQKDLYEFDSEGYNNVFDQTVANPAYRNFKEKLAPSITGQFRSNNLQNSSYVGDSLSKAGRDVQENLDAQRSANVFQGQQQAKQNKINGTQTALGMSTFAYQKPGAQTPNGVDQILQSLAPSAGEWLADYLKGMKKPNSPTV